MENVAIMVEQMVAKQPQDNNQNVQLEQALLNIAIADEGAKHGPIHDILVLLDADFSELEEEPESIEIGVNVTELMAATGSESDLAFFKQLMEQTEQRNPAWQGRGARTLTIALEMNKAAGDPIALDMLTAAIYIHDYAMGYLPDNDVENFDLLADEIDVKYHNHPLIAAQLIGRMSGWIDAQEIVLQHHEQPDGKGYPQKLTEAQICNDALLLSVADAYTSLTLPAEDAGHKRSVLKALFELSNHVGSRYSETWVSTLTNVIKSQYLSAK